MRHKIFDPNNPFYQFMKKLVWTFVFNIIFLLTCIPVITLFPSAVACAGVFLQITDERSKNWVKEYVLIFAKRLKVSLFYGVILILFVCLMMTEFYLFSAETGVAKVVGYAVGIFVILVFTVFYIGLMHIAAKFQYGIRETWMATRFFVQKNLGMACVSALFFILIGGGLGVLMWYVPYINWMIIFWFGLAFLASAYPYNAIFARYLYEDEVDFTDEELASFSVLGDRLEKEAEEDETDGEDLQQ